MNSVLLLSGGMDSAVLLAVLVAEKGASEIACLSFAYGQKHERKEMNAGRALAEHYGVHREHIALPFIGQFFRSALLRGGSDIPIGHYADPKQEATVVPFRNGIFLAIAAGYAESHGATEVVIGAHLGDAAIYPDCRRPFVKDMDQAVYRGTNHSVKVRAPFVEGGMRKTDIVTQGNILRVPWGLTWSCYLGGEEPCGSCGACIERVEALGL